MNTGAEAVETALKVARKWGYEVKGVPPDRARIVVAAGNFHGRTTTIVGFSTDPDARGGFGPFTPGFAWCRTATPTRCGRRSTPDTVAVLIEPIQGEAGVVVPPAGYLPAVRRRSAPRPACCSSPTRSSPGSAAPAPARHRAAGVVADVYLLGKALGGGIVPVSAVVADADVLGVLRPGQHGSTFGGNPLACAVGRAVVELLADPADVLARARPARRAAARRLARWSGTGSSRCAGAGLWAGLDVDPRLRHRPRRSASAGRARGAGQGHPRLDDPAVSAAGDHRGESWGSRWTSWPKCWTNCDDLHSAYSLVTPPD